MIVGVPKEVKDNENRVAITPAGVKTFKKNGHKVIIEESAGTGSGISDQDYHKAGAEILKSGREVYEKADLVIKIKEPQPEEYDYLDEKTALFTYLHLAAEPDVTQALLKNNVPSIAYETVEDSEGNLPLLTPMSEVAVILPLKGWSENGRKGWTLHDSEVDNALLTAFKEANNPDIDIMEVNVYTYDAVFADKSSEKLDVLVQKIKLNPQAISI